MSELFEVFELHCVFYDYITSQFERVFVRIRSHKIYRKSKCFSGHLSPI
jgi:hypothetical protein